MPAMFQRVAFSLVEVPIAFGVGFAAFVGVYALACSIAHCVDVSGAGWALLGLAIGVVLGVAYWFVAMGMGTRVRRRLVWDGFAILVGIAGYAVPQLMSELATARYAAQAAKSNQEYVARRLAWIESLKSRAHGPPGEVPPMLAIIDDGTAAVVTNTSSTVRRTVALARVVPDAVLPGVFKSCGMYSDGPHAYHRYSMAPGETMRFRPDPGCAGAFAGAAIEYRVGNDPRDEGWWSDSAFTAPEGRDRGNYDAPGALRGTPPATNLRSERTPR